MTIGRKLVVRGFVALVVLLVLAVAAVLAIEPRAIARAAMPEPRASADLIQRGEYLARAGDCTACHTAPGGKPFAGGLALDTPFGKIVASNITPDRDTGIGGWTEAAFARALRQGVSTDGHLLYPAMPYNDYTKVSDADVHALKAYLDSLPPVHRASEANQLPFPFNIRQMMLGWNLLFFSDARYRPDLRQSADWNRGKYLVDGLGHCTACHTGKNLLGGDEAYLQGGALQGWYAPELSGSAYLGLGKWSAGDVAAYLKTGGTDRAMATGPMAEAVEHSTQYLSDPDLVAIATYLKSLPSSDRVAPVSIPKDDPAMIRGRALYAINCAACHRSSGAGVATMLPALASSPTVQAPDASGVIHTILSGGAAAATRANPTGARMPGFAWKLDDADVAAIATDIRNSWGNVAPRVTASEVRRVRRSIGAQGPLHGKKD
jgi:mono/diheme cytochrome c family protein